MSNYRTTYKRSAGLWGRWLTILVLPTGAAAAVTAGLWGAGYLRVPWLESQRPRPLPPGHVAVPLCLRTARAGTVITREHLYDPQTLQPRTVPLAAELVARRRVLVDPQEIVGRVLAREKREGYSFTEGDFHPPGTRAGLVSLIPPGKRSLTLEAARIEGVFGLNAGDHVDLVATVTLPTERGQRSAKLVLLGGQRGAVPQIQVRVLAQDAVVVMPVTTRQKPVASSSLTQGMRVRTIPVEEVVFAVSPDEVAGIAEAMASEARLTCVARSGRPEAADLERETTGKDPLAELHTIEAITGTERELLTFPGAQVQRATHVAGGEGERS